MAVEDKPSRVLLSKASVVTRAVLWKIQHSSSKEDICLKIGRYKKNPWFPQADELETREPKNELTLTNVELKALIEYLTESYEPFRQGVKSFITLDKPFSPDHTSQLKALLASPDQQGLIQFILAENVLPEELANGLRQAGHLRAIRECEEMLKQDLVEPEWQQPPCTPGTDSEPRPAWP